jgi:hypothetical protein
MIRPLILLVATLVLTFPLLALGAPVEQFAKPEDGQDFAPAIDRAMVACAGAPCSIELGPRAYTVSRPIDVCAPLELSGVGPAFELLGSVITTRRFTAIRTWHQGKCPRKDIPATQGHLVIRDVALRNMDVRGAGVSIPGEQPFFGLDVRTRVHLENMQVRGYVQGLRMVCSAKEEGSNCNVSSVRAFDAVTSEHSGVFVQGADANAILFDRVSASGSCRMAARWEALTAGVRAKYSYAPVCAALYDASFLGNQWNAAHVANTPKPSLGFAVIGNSNYSTLLGTYLELDSSPGYADKVATIIGGHSGFTGPAGQLRGATMPGLSIVPGDGRRLDFGVQTNRGGATMRAASPGTGGRAWWMSIGAQGEMVWDRGGGAVGLVPWGP